MSVETTVNFQAMAPSPALRAEIERQAQKLARYAPRLMACNVTIGLGEQRHQQGNRYQVHVHAVMPGGEFDSGRSPPMDHRHEDAYVAVGDAFDAMRRQLEDHVRIQRGEVKAQPSDRPRSMRH